MVSSKRCGNGRDGIGAGSGLLLVLKLIGDHRDEDFVSCRKSLVQPWTFKEGIGVNYALHHVVRTVSFADDVHTAFRSAPCLSQSKHWLLAILGEDTSWWNSS
mmetsp:Transcript_26987/g.63110  ORF Transcript_26987/g.63110 Transcript_26987/m.63110 type:complete len:103 (-) Transcript_26987:331-639(-)